MAGVTFVFVYANGPASPADHNDRQPGNVLGEESSSPSCRHARYTQSSLKTTLQTAGCKPWVAHKASKGVFMALNIRLKERGQDDAGLHGNHDGPEHPGIFPGSMANPLPRHEWIGLVMTRVAQLTDAQLQLEDFEVASSIHERRRSVAILVAGTSGCGKSTLAGLLASRLGITTLLSTDSIRHMMRSFTPKEANPILWASTYQAGDCLRPQQEGGRLQQHDSVPCPALGRSSSARARAAEAKALAVKGYTAQSELVYAGLDALLGSCAARRESVVIEGVLLSMDSIMRLMAKHRTIIPFLIHISNEAKHRERFAVRAKYMTLEAGANRYVHYLDSIRAIQEHLVQGAVQYSIPTVNNTNVDRSVAIIHATVLACLRRQAQGADLYDAASGTAAVPAAEYSSCIAQRWSSKVMLQLIKHKAALQALTHEQPSSPSIAHSPAVNVEQDEGEEMHSQFMSSDAGSVTNEGGSHDGGEVSTAAATRMDGSVLETETDMEDHMEGYHPYVLA